MIKSAIITGKAMKEEIKRKLADSLAGSFSEQAVTYILVKVRELLDAERSSLAETDQRVKEINSLKAYCDWTVHVEMTYAGRTKPFLKAIDDYVQGLASDKKEIETLYYLEDFRSRLEQFLNEEKIPSDLTTNLERWVEFLRHYAGIVHNRTMTYEGPALTQVRRMTFTTIVPAASIYIFDAQGCKRPLPFGVKVAITKKDGSTASLILPEWKLE
jgi:hypothetical protein